MALGRLEETPRATGATKVVRPVVVMARKKGKVVQVLTHKKFSGRLPEHSDACLNHVYCRFWLLTARTGPFSLGLLPSIVLSGPGGNLFFVFHNSSSVETRRRRRVD